MNYKSFYICYSTNDEVQPDDAVDLDRDGVISVAQQILREPGDIFGLFDKNKAVLQLLYEQSGEIWLEIPFPEKEGSYGKHISLNELESFLVNLPDNFSTESISGLEFILW